MISQFSNLSSWREDNIVVPASDVFCLDFLDTKPNMFIVQNPNNSNLRVSIARIPTSEKHEFTVGANTTEVIGRPIPTGKIYFLNEGSEAAVTVYSIAMEFDLAAMKSINVNLFDAQIETDGIVRGWAQGVKLPAGDNNIGHVTVDNGTFALTSAQIALIETLVSATAVSGKTNLRSLRDSVDYLSSNVTNKVNEILATMTASPTTTPVYENGAIAFSYQNTGSTRKKVHFNWLLNDGGLMTFNLTQGETITSLLSIREGEQFSDFEFEVPAGATLWVNSTQPLWRCKYYIVEG